VPRVLTAWEAPWYRWVLRVHEARAHRVIDGARIAGADFHGVG